MNSNPFPTNASQTDIIATSLGGGIQVTIDSKIVNEAEYPIGNGNISFDGSLLGDVAGNAEITFTFSTPIYGFGANFEGLDPNQEVTLGLSASQLVTNGFVGIESSTPFSSITLYDQGFYTADDHPSMRVSRKLYH